MSLPVWMVNLIKKTFPQRFFLAKLTNAPVIGAVIDHALFEGDDIIFLPKDKVIPINRYIDKPDSVILPSQVVEHFIKKANFHWIMNECICRAATGCKDYPINLGCLFLGDAAMGINPKLGRHVGKDAALDHARQCRDAGLVHLIGRNKLDTVWLNVRPGNKLLTICNCCPCCCLWKILPIVAPEIGAKITKMPGITISVSDRCQGCGTCAQKTCFVGAIYLDDDHAVISEACRGCGRCVSVCPNNAIDMVINNDLFIKDTIDRISPLVDVT